MSQRDMIGVVVVVALASVLVRLMILNPVFGRQVNQISARLF